MEQLIAVLNVALFVAGCFIIGLVSDAAKYKAQAKAYKKMLRKAGLLEEPAEDDNSK